MLPLPVGAAHGTFATVVDLVSQVLWRRRGWSEVGCVGRVEEGKEGRRLKTVGARIDSLAVDLTATSPDHSMQA